MRPDRASVAAAVDRAMMDSPHEVSPFERDLLIAIVPIVARLCAVPAAPAQMALHDTDPPRPRRKRGKAA